MGQMENVFRFLLCIYIYMWGFYVCVCVHRTNLTFEVHRLKALKQVGILQACKGITVLVGTNSAA